MAMNFLKDWIIQYQNKFSVGGTETTIKRVTGTVSQKGDKISAAYLNEIQKNCIYQVSATRVIEGVLEIYDISINGSEEFTPFNQTFLIDFDVTNTRVDSLLRFNGITYSLRFSDSIANGDKSPSIGFIPKRAVVKLDVSNSKAIIIDDITIIQSLLDLKANLASPAFTGTPTTPTPTTGGTGQQIVNLDFVNAMLGGNTVPAKNLSANGYVKMANGLILQWGNVNIGGNAAVTVTLPLAFPDACVSAVATMITSSNFDESWSVYNVSKTAISVRNSNGATLGYYWIAIGY